MDFEKLQFTLHGDNKIVLLHGQYMFKSEETEKKKRFLITVCQTC